MLQAMVLGALLLAIVVYTQGGGGNRSPRTLMWVANMAGQHAQDNARSAALGSVRAQSDMLCSQAPKLTIVTPWGSNKFDYLPTIVKSIEWDCVAQWIIIYDTHRVKVATPQFRNNQKVLEVFYNAPKSVFGNLQRQEGLDRVTDGMIYLLDDDNAMHPRFWKWFAANASLGHIYTFDQLRHKGQPILLRGDKPIRNCIDTAQVLFDRALVGNISWSAVDYHADGLFIHALVQQHQDRHMYVPQVLAYHNFAKHLVNGVPWTRLAASEHNSSITRRAFVSKRCSASLGAGR